MGDDYFMTYWAYSLYVWPEHTLTGRIEAIAQRINPD